MNVQLQGIVLNVCTTVSDTASLASSHSGLSHDAGSQHQTHSHQRHPSTDLYPSVAVAAASQQYNGGAGDSPGTDFVLQHLTPDDDAATEDAVSAEYDVFVINPFLSLIEQIA